ncbi:MAG: hypothetical protein HY823_02500 [Acidobacteria bacterium]|nr:hypothetical protein [Acidobacteriota bacterium]
MPSASTALSRALERMEGILFRPFDAGKWFVLGFSAFLASLGEGGSFNPGGIGNHGGAPAEIQSWVQDHMAFVIALAVGILVFALALGILFAWLSSRGAFMFLDNVLHDRAEVREPWRRFRAQGNRLFVFTLVAGLACIGAFLLLVLAGAVVLVPMLKDGWHFAALLPILLFAALFVVLLLAVLLFWAFLRDFGVPLMARQGLSPMEALGCLRREVLPGHAWDFTRFYLLKFVLALGAGLLVLAAGCLTCCIGFLPYLSAVLTLPVSVFFRCYSLEFLAQVDPRWDFFPAPPSESAPAQP